MIDTIPSKKGIYLIPSINTDQKTRQKMFSSNISTIFQESSFLLYSGLHGGHSLGIKRPRERKACPVCLLWGTDRCESALDSKKKRLRAADLSCMRQNRAKLFSSQTRVRALTYPSRYNGVLYSNSA